jgi:hypothetical protein
MKPIKVSEHAVYSMIKRGIFEEEARFVLEKPDCVRNSFDNRKLATKDIVKGKLTVVFIEKEKYINVITAYYEDDGEKNENDL